MQNIINATVAISAMGLIFGALLGLAAKIFHVKQDEKLPLITVIQWHNSASFAQ